MTDVIKDSNLKRERERVSQAREGRQKVSSTIHRQSFIHTRQYLPEADERPFNAPVGSTDHPPWPTGRPTAARGVSCLGMAVLACG